MKIALTSDPKSTLFRGPKYDDHLHLAADILAYQLRHQVAPAYGWLPALVHAYPTPADVPHGWFMIVLYDRPDVEGALGYHDEDGLPYGKVFLQPAHDTGSTSLVDGPYPVLRTIMHEGIELFGDPRVNIWADLENGTETPYELCDAVEDDPLIVHLPDGRLGPGSNFVYPAWFDARAATDAGAGARVKFDYMRNLTAPFTMTHNGYMTLRHFGSGRIEQVFGARVPDWKRASKVPGANLGAARTQRFYGATPSGTP